MFYKCGSWSLQLEKCYVKTSLFVIYSENTKAGDTGRDRTKEQERHKVAEKQRLKAKTTKTHTENSSNLKVMTHASSTLLSGKIYFMLSCFILPKN